MRTLYSFYHKGMHILSDHFQIAETFLQKKGGAGFRSPVPLFIPLTVLLRPALYADPSELDQVVLHQKPIIGRSRIQR